MADSVVTAYLTKTLGQGDHFAEVGNMDDEQIAQRILKLKADAGSAILEIGRWLCVMKSRKKHGEWITWLAEKVDFSERIAQQYMQIYEGFSSNPNALSDLGKTKALKLLSLPPAEREEFLSEHNVVDMTARQLDDAIRRQKELERETEKLSEQLEIERQNAETMNNTNEDLRRRIFATETANKALLADKDRDEARIVSLINEVKELKDRPVEVAVQVDEEAVTKAAEEARAAAEAEWKARLDAANQSISTLQKRFDAAEAKAKKAEEKAKSAAGKVDAGELDAAKQAEQEARAEAERLRAALEAAKQEQKSDVIASDADLALAAELGGQIAGAANKLRGILVKARNREDNRAAEAVRKALLSLAEQIRGCAE